MNLKEIKIIGFDADDTLWENEIYYRNTENEFANIMRDFLGKEESVEELFKIEMQNLSLYGYGAKSFTLSMLETALKISNGSISAEKIGQIIDLGKRLINQPVILLKEVEVVLSFCKKKYKLILATKGDLLDQERKLKKSALAKYFHHIEIMSDKKAENYTKLISRLEISPKEFLMIGNSVKSDILPLVSIGSNAIHVPYETTWEHEKVDEKLTSEHCMKVEKLIDILNYL